MRRHFTPKCPCVKPLDLIGFVGTTSPRMSPVRSFVAACLASLLWLCAAQGARADSLAVGPHLGINLDYGNLHLGGDIVIPIAPLSPNVSVAVWPSYAHVFIEDGHDVELLGCDFPFFFKLDNSILTPFVAPGLGLAFYGDTSLKLNVIGGTFFETHSTVRPFVALALRFIDGTFVDLLGGVLFEL